VGDIVSVERVIPAPPEPIFDLLADPARHREIDGSGTVREASEGSQRLKLGSRFGMSMKMGVPYSMVSEVVEFEEGRRIAWQTRGSGRLGSHAGGRVWRYELEPAEGGTCVRESWDVTEESWLSKWLVKLTASKQTAGNMAKTLERIEQIVAGEGPGPTG
jgi:uncharacterized protein YndB with AHSA1/START domain